MWHIVYTTNKAVLADDVGRRLENFFWRIWSNSRISSSIRGSQMALLFMSISEGAEIRTTPTQSPRSRSSYLEEDYRHIRRSPPRLSKALAPSTTSSAASDREEVLRSARVAIQADTLIKAPRKLSSSQERRRDTRRPPPILKKPKAGSSTHLPKTARILSPTTRKESELDIDGESPVSSTQSEDSTSSLSTECVALSLGRGAARPRSDNEHLEVDGQRSLPQVSPTIQRLIESVPQANVSQRPGRKKAAYTANTAATKRRPALGHRKSSQSSSGNAPKAPSPHSAAPSKMNLESPPPLQSLGTPLDDVDSSLISPNTMSDTSTGKARSIIPTLPLEDRSSELSRSSSPHQSRHPRCQHQGRLATGLGPDLRRDEERRHQDWLVDRDFRSKFVERTRPSESHGLASLHTHRTKSSAAVAAPASYQAHGTMGFSEQTPGGLLGKSKEKLTFTNKTVPVKAAGASSEAIINNDDNDDHTPRALSRTKSQLTLLLERDRRVNEQEQSKEKQQVGKTSSGLHRLEP